MFELPLVRMHTIAADSSIGACAFCWAYVRVCKGCAARDVLQTLHRTQTAFDALRSCACSPGAADGPP